MNILYFAPFNSRGTNGEVSRRYLESLLTDKSLNIKLLPYPAGDNKIYAGRDDLASVERYVVKSEQEFQSFIKQDYTLLWQMPPQNLIYERRINEGVWHLFAIALENAKQNININIFDYCGGITRNAANLLKQYGTAKMIVPAQTSSEDEVLLAKHGVSLTTVPPRYKDNTTAVPMPTLEKNLADKFVILVCGSWQEKNGFDFAITSFLSEFQHQRDVVLVVKTYPQDTPKEEITESLKTMRNRVRLSDFNEMATADVVLIAEHLSDGNMAWLTDRCDVMLHTPLVDGACTAQFEAGLRGKAIILSQIHNLSGIQANVTTCRSTSDTPYGYVDCSPDMSWRVPNIKAVREELRKAYIRWDKFKDLGNAGRETRERLLKLQPAHEKVVESFKKVIAE